MPAVLDEAYISPFHHYRMRGFPSDTTAEPEDSTASLRNPDRPGTPHPRAVPAIGSPDPHPNTDGWRHSTTADSAGFQTNYYVSQPVPFAGSANYSTYPSQPGWNTLDTLTPASSPFPPAKVDSLYDEQQFKAAHQQYDCDRLVAQLLSCQRCRRKIMRILNDEDRESLSHSSSPSPSSPSPSSPSPSSHYSPSTTSKSSSDSQSGGAWPMSKDNSDLLVCVAIGLLVILLIQRVMKN